MFIVDFIQELNKFVDSKNLSKCHKAAKINGGFFLVISKTFSKIEMSDFRQMNFKLWLFLFKKGKILL